MFCPDHRLGMPQMSQKRESQGQGQLWWSQLTRMSNRSCSWEDNVSHPVAASRQRVEWNLYFFLSESPAFFILVKVNSNFHVANPTVSSHNIIFLERVAASDAADNSLAVQPFNGSGSRIQTPGPISSWLSHSSFGELNQFHAFTFPLDAYKSSIYSAH